LYKQLHSTAPPVAPQTLQPPTPPPPPVYSPTPGSATSSINMESFLAGLNFSRNYSQVQPPTAPTFLPAPAHLPVFLPHTPPAFHPPPPPPAERLTMENIISLIKAAQPDRGYHGHHYPGPGIPGLPSYPPSYPPYYGYGPSH